MQASKLETIQGLVRNSFDIFNTYGKDTGSLETIQMAFWVVLKNIKEKYIKMAFQEWLETKANMPAPSEIREMAIRFENTYDRPKNTTKAIKAKPRSVRSVAWHGIGADEFKKNKETYLPMMRDHYIILKTRHGEEKAKSYFTQFLGNYLHYDIEINEII